MSALVPNLSELEASLPEGSSGAEAAATFDVANLPAAKAALRALVVGWEHAHSDPAAAEAAQEER